MVQQNATKRFHERPTAERLSETKKVLFKYAPKKPVIAQPAPRSKFDHIADMKMILPEGMSLAMFYSTVRMKLQLKPEEALFFTVGNTIPSLSTTIGSIYEEYKSKEDEFLYIVYCEESVYGA